MDVRGDRAVPVLPVRDVATALVLYQRLGFAARAYGGPDATDPEYGFLSLDTAELHLSRFPSKQHAA